MKRARTHAELPMRVRGQEWCVYRLLPRLLSWLERIEALFFKPKFNRPPSQAAGDAILIILHNRGGGADKQAHDEAVQFARAGHAVYCLTFQPFLRRFVLFSENTRHYFFVPWQQRSLNQRLATLRLGEIRLHHVRFWPFYAARELPKLAHSLGARFTVMLHDYVYLCPRIHLLDGDYRYCGLPEDSAACDACIAHGGTFVRHVDNVGAWRQGEFAFLKAADRIRAPSADTAQRYKKIFPALEIEIQPHATDSVNVTPPPVANGMRPVRIAVVANLLRHKGADSVLAAADAIVRQNLPIDLSIIGATVYKPEFVRLGISVTGAYVPQDLPLHLRRAAPDYVWLPSVWPETYSFVLSEVWNLGYRVIAFDLGAIAERIHRRGTGQDRLLPLALSEDILGLCQALAQLRAA